VLAPLEQRAEFGELGLDAPADLLAKAEDPLVDDPVVDLVALFVATDDAGLGQQLQVLGDVLLRGTERFGQLVDGRLAGP